MDAVSLFRGSPCASSSFFRSAPEKPTTSLSYTPAFQPRSNLFSYLSSRPHAPKQKSLTKRRIFLPHLVASMQKMEETYIMIKPDGVQRGLVGEIISRFEKKGFKLTGLKLFECPQELAEEHYKDLNSKPFFPKLIRYITSGPVVCMAWEGDGVVASARKLIGATNPLQAEPGTIRGDLAVQTGRNVVHGSDSPENGKREIALWFKEGELCEWTPAQAAWLLE
ncbi:nucleoside diphosphate kinase 2, chloroplastic [Rhododendron vialii]|uniref:nucleoside diphosphate kinase 2, chloroplastic n=1 Tax=Rhododendron vialii TaxID=182163 RepID=UPI00265F0A06|nr:nucleoside diphosphate kinase 2, chloroplastic [Rhododendron vialii]